MDHKEREGWKEQELEEQDIPREETEETASLSEEDDLQTLQQEYDELKEKYLRLYAEFDNYKKRTVREKLDLMKTAAQDTMAVLLPVLDDFDRAKKSAEENDKGDLFREGVGLVYQKLYNSLRQKGLEAMDTDGQPFDPELHEALTEVPAPSEDMKGKIVDTIEKGYKLNDRIIRHAKVVVGK